MVLAKVLPLMVLCLLTVGLRRAGVLHSEDSKTVGKLLSSLAIPAVVIKAIATTSLTPDLIYLPLSAIIVVSALTGVGLLLNWGLGWPRPTAGALAIAFPTLEGGAVGLPLMFLAFGDLGISRFILFDLTQAIFLFTVVYGLSAWFGQAEASLQRVLLKLLKTPLIWSIVLGLLLNLLNIKSQVVLDLLAMGGNSFLLLILVLLGLELQIKISALPLHLVLTLLKTACGLSLGLLLARAFGLTGVERAAVIIGAAQPPSLLTILFAKENQLDVGFVVNLVSISVPFSLLFLSTLLNFL